MFFCQPLAVLFFKKYKEKKNPCKTIIIRKGHLKALLYCFSQINVRLHLLTDVGSQHSLDYIPQHGHGKHIDHQY